ncbi:MAG: S8 family peptidase [Halobacteriota archaeon]
MNKKYPSLVIISILIIVSIVAAASTTPVGTVSPSAIHNTKEVIIGFKNNTISSLHFQQAITTKYDCNVLETNNALNCVLVQVTGEDTGQVINRLSEEDLVKYVEPNKLVHALYTPNDPHYSEQWGPQHIKANSAWDIEKGNKNVTIAVIDTGIDYEHEDLGDNYVAGGYDWVNNDFDPMDDYGHGTHCAGIAAAILDNEKGIAGIAQVNLMAEKVLNETGWGTEWGVALGIVQAADNNADIISLSLGGDDAQVMEDACLYAWNNGCLLVAASGNDGKRGVTYPAAYETVIAVGAIDQNGHRCGFSNWGPKLELVAPGVGILSTYLSNQYAWMGGTSMAAPHVAGVAALVWSKYPLLSNHEVRDRLAQTADDLGAVGFDEYYGYGKVDALNATKLVVQAFDTKQPQNPYPSISGAHNGTLKPNVTIEVSTLYTYPCPGTGGHTEYARIWNSTIDVNATWEGYVGDWHNISFSHSFTLLANETYNYTIITGSYPQIIHETPLNATGGTITCDEFVDANRGVYYDWIPAIRLE